MAASINDLAERQKKFSVQFSPDVRRQTSNGSGPGTGIATILACPALNQAAYIFVQIFGPRLTFDPSLDNVRDGEPRPGR